MSLTTKAQHEVQAQPWQREPHLLICFRHSTLPAPASGYLGIWRKVSKDQESISTSVFSKSSFTLNHLYLWGFEWFDSVCFLGGGGEGDDFCEEEDGSFVYALVAP